MEPEESAQRKILDSMPVPTLKHPKTGGNDQNPGTEESML